MAENETRRSDQAFWERHAQHDPLWAILSDPAKKGRGWTLEAFLESGAREISLLFYELQQLDLEPARDRALDFGCGVGRLSQALGDLFDEVVGVDVSPTMIRLARLVNRHGPRVSYVENPSDDLRLLRGRFTFVYSNIVLQHIPPAQAVGYLREFLRLAAPGGVVVFQLPSHQRPSELQEARPNAMPPAAYRHTLRLESGAPPVLGPNREIVVRVAVSNTSPIAWTQSVFGSIRLGNHWLDAGHDRMIVQDDGRVAVRETFAPGETQTLLLPVRTPGQDGRYWCEIDLAHEGVTWFGDRGATTLRVPVEVRAIAPTDGDVAPGAADALARRAAAAVPSLDQFYAGLPRTAEEPENFPMFGVPSDAVEAVIREGGCALVHREADGRAGPEWVAYRYFVRRD